MRLFARVFLFSVALSTGAVDAQQLSETNYLNCPPPPADAPVLFAKGIVSRGDRYEEKICFSSDGTEMFFGVHPDGGKNYFRPSVMHAKHEAGEWSQPKRASFIPQDKFVGWPLLSLQGTVLYMEEVGGTIVSSTKKNKDWSKLETLDMGSDLEASQGVGLAQITDDQTFYFYTRHERVAYYSKLVDGKRSKPQPLPYQINPAVEFFVSPKNDYIIFQPIEWTNQFHISFRKRENQWSMPVPFSNYFDRKKDWQCRGCAPYVSPDGKYFFFSNRGDIYWVKTDFIGALKKTSDSRVP